MQQAQLNRFVLQRSAVYVASATFSALVKTPATELGHFLSQPQPGGGLFKCAFVARVLGGKGIAFQFFRRDGHGALSLAERIYQDVMGDSVYIH